MRPLFVTAHTDDERYSRMGDRLAASCQKFDLELIRVVLKYLPPETIGDDIPRMKPGILIKPWILGFKRPLVWIDADAEVLRLPDFTGGWFEVADVAAVVRQGDFLGSLIYFAPTERAYGVLTAWRALCDAAKGKKRPWDQQILHQLLKDYPDDQVFAELPGSYSHIFDDPGVEDAVIVQYQASRELRAKGLMGVPRSTWGLAHG